MIWAFVSIGCAAVCVLCTALIYWALGLMTKALDDVREEVREVTVEMKASK